MADLNFKAVLENNLPATGTNVGEIYFTDKQNLYLTKSDKSLMKISDIVFIANKVAVTNPLTNKLYYQVSDNTIHRWNGSAWVALTVSTPVANTLVYKGTWDATLNSPTITSGSGTVGHFYIVKNSGVTNIDGTSTWVEGDWLIYNGTKWERVINSNEVVSVNGKIGAVTLTKTDVGLSNVTNDAQIPLSQKGVANGVATLDANGKVTVLSNVTNDQQVKVSEIGQPNGVAGLDANQKLLMENLPPAILGALSYKGTWNAATNTPDLSTVAKTKGDYYIVNVAGTTSVNGISVWNLNDWIVYNGTTFDKVDNSNAVTSVAGRTGAVVLTKNDVGLGNVTNDAQIPLTQKGVANGVATLNTYTHIPDNMFNAKNAITVRQTTQQTLTLGNNEILWDSILYQRKSDGITADMWTATDKPKIWIKKAGTYMITCSYRVYDPQAAAERYLGIFHNGTIIGNTGVVATNTTTLNVTGIAYCNANDYIYAIFYHGHTNSIKAETGLGSLKLSVFEI